MTDLKDKLMPDKADAASLAHKIPKIAHRMPASGDALFVWDKARSSCSLVQRFIPVIGASNLTETCFHEYGFVPVATSISRVSNLRSRTRSAACFTSEL